MSVRFSVDEPAVAVSEDAASSAGPVKFVPHSPAHSACTVETEPLFTSSVRSTSSSNGSGHRLSGSRSLRANLTRQRKNCDPLETYEVVQILGVGSMGTVAKVRKKIQSIGGSARLSNVVGKTESPCFSVPLIGGLFRYCINKRESSKHPSSHSDLRTAASNHSVVSYESSAYTEMLFAMKSIHLNRITDPAFIEELKNEVEILKTLDHPHVVRAIETFEHRNQIFVVQELCSGGDLYTRDPYTEDEAARIVSSVLGAVNYMHAKGVVHRDIKYENILFVNKSPKAEVKLIDFGLSRKFLDHEELTEGVGTIYTMAPEVLRQSYGKESDLWSVGVISFMLLSSRMPFYGRERKHVIESILSGKYKFRGQRWKRISQQAKDFVADLLITDPEERMDAEEAMASAWLNRRHTATVRNPFAQELTSANESLLRFANYSKLKKVALMVVAHKSTSDDIGILRKVFQQYDTSGDGQLGYDEFKAAVSELGLHDENCQELFESIDLDGSGKIRYTEFLAATIETFGKIGEDRLAEAFDRLDSDDSGYISTENLTEMLGPHFPKEEIDEIIREADLYGDGRISYAEFLALWEGQHGEERQVLLNELVIEPVAIVDSFDSSFNRADFAEGKVVSERSVLSK